MKMIIAVVQPIRLRAVREALYEAGVQRITICDAQEFANHQDRAPIYRGVEYRTDIVRKITLEIAVNDDFVERAVEIIQNVYCTEGDESEGEIFIFPIVDAVELCSQQRGPSAI